MRDLASCLGEYAVQVSDTSCSNYTNNPCISPNFTPSVQTSVTCLYRTLPSNQKQMMIALTWSKTASSHALTINFDHDPSTLFKITTNSRFFRKSKGCRSLHLRSSKIEIHWDLSTARYQPGPEPIENYYVAVLVDSDLALTLGNKDRELAAKSGANFALVSRQEHFSGSNVYSTKARFSDDGGGAHDISIRCSGESEGLKHPVLSVSIDKKMVIRVKKLQWNFRGNQTIFVDGLLVDLMWDVHDWFYNNSDSGSGSGSGHAVFMFRRRSGLDSRLWMEENSNSKVQDNHVDFSFIIYAFQFHILFRRNYSKKFVEDDVKLGQEPELLQKQPEECKHINEVSLETKGWKKGLFCGKVYSHVSHDRCNFSEDLGFCYVKIPQNENVASQLCNMKY